MSLALAQVHHPHRLADLNVYGVQELTTAEAMATSGGVLPLFGVIAAIVGADAAIMAAAAALLGFLASRADKE